MAMTDDEIFAQGSSSHPVVARFRKTISEIRGSKTQPPTSMIREKREQLRRQRLELQAEVDELRDEDDDPSTDSIDDEPITAPA
jgi:hypothetical protein